MPCRADLSRELCVRALSFDIFVSSKHCLETLISSLRRPSRLNPMSGCSQHMHMGPMESSDPALLSDFSPQQYFAVAHGKAFFAPAKRGDRTVQLIVTGDPQMVAQMLAGIFLPKNTTALQLGYHLTNEILHPAREVGWYNQKPVTSFAFQPMLQRVR
jgi:hypothetical protein